MLISIKYEYLTLETKGKQNNYLYIFHCKFTLHFCIFYFNLVYNKL